MQHLERHLPEIEKIFTKFRISKFDYHLFAGFEERLLQGDRYLEQIHIAIRFKPRNMTCLLKRLGPILLPFSAIIFTDKSFHCLPSSTADLDAIVCTMSRGFTDDMKTTHTISASTFLSKNVDMGGALNVGGLSHQNTSDGDREGETNPGPTEINKSWNSRIAFDIVSDLHDPSQPKGIQALQLQGEIIIEVWNTLAFIHHTFLRSLIENFWIRQAPRFCNLPCRIHRASDYNPCLSWKPGLQSFSPLCCYWSKRRACLDRWYTTTSHADVQHRSFIPSQKRIFISDR